MNGFDIALVGVGGGRDAHVLAVTKSFGEIALELAAVVGLPEPIAERDAVAIQMLLDARSEDGAGRGAACVGEGPEEQAAADIACGVLDDGQSELLGLGPTAWDVVQVLGVGLLEQSPAGFDMCEVLFALVFSAAFGNQAVGVPDPFQSTVADGEIDCGKAAAWKTKDRFSTPLGNPADPAGFPLSHSLDDDYLPLLGPKYKSISLRRFSLKKYTLARWSTSRNN